MAVQRSDKFYFARGDLVIQVENTLFRLHRDILERHSGFFEGMFSMPTNDDTEGTEENPLVLPSDLCSARSFVILCKFLYPRTMGSQPVISVNKLEEWEPVLRATAALQMQETRKVILASLDKDMPNIKCDAAKLLRQVLNYAEDAPPSFLATCLRILAYRRKRITPEEINILGEKGTCLVNHARERVWETLSLLHVELIQRLRKAPNIMREEHGFCKIDAMSGLLMNLSVSQLRTTGRDDTYDIFSDDSDQGTCESCTLAQGETRKSLKGCWT
ncbi:hypothetical protein B0J17DRAFT_50402 [Rhizoctonia solani]|nr:hypothetical protein B0J17DRAFT_50402 [Rhizoctonia solani]